MHSIIVRTFRVVFVKPMKLPIKCPGSSTREDGFTLVEILVTLAILAAVLPALLNAFATAARNQALSDNSTTALYLLKFQMAQIEMEGFPDVGEASGEFGENSRYRWDSIIEDIESEEIENVRRVQVTVTWIHKSRGAFNVYDDFRR